MNTFNRAISIRNENKPSLRGIIDHEAGISIPNLHSAAFTSDSATFTDIITTNITATNITTTNLNEITNTTISVDDNKLILNKPSEVGASSTEPTGYLVFQKGNLLSSTAQADETVLLISPIASTTTPTITLLTETTDDYYKDCFLVHNGVVRYITAYDGTTQTLTLNTALAFIADNVYIFSRKNITLKFDQFDSTPFGDETFSIQSENIDNDLITPEKCSLELKNISATNDVQIGNDCTVSHHLLASTIKSNTGDSLSLQKESVTGATLAISDTLCTLGSALDLTLSAGKQVIADNLFSATTLQLYGNSSVLAIFSPTVTSISNAIDTTGSIFTLNETYAQFGTALDMKMTAGKTIKCDNYDSTGSTTLAIKRNTQNVLTNNGTSTILYDGVATADATLALTLDSLTCGSAITTFNCPSIIKSIGASLYLKNSANEPILYQDGSRVYIYYNGSATTSLVLDATTVDINGLDLTLDASKTIKSDNYDTTGATNLAIKRNNATILANDSSVTRIYGGGGNASNSRFDLTTSGFTLLAGTSPVNAIGSSNVLTLLYLDTSFNTSSSTLKCSNITSHSATDLLLKRDTTTKLTIGDTAATFSTPIIGVGSTVISSYASSYDTLINLKADQSGGVNNNRAEFGACNDVTTYGTAINFHNANLTTHILGIDARNITDSQTIGSTGTAKVQFYKNSIATTGAGVRQISFFDGSSIEAFQFNTQPSSTTYVCAGTDQNLCVGTSLAITGAKLTVNGPISTPDSVDLSLERGGAVNIIAKSDGLIQKAPITPAADGSFIREALVSGSISFYLDEGNNKLMIKVMYSDGTTFKSGEVALT